MATVDTAGAEAPPPEELTITFFDVGQGDCTLIECGEGYEILVDCGSNRRGAGDRDRDDVAAFLEEHIEGDLDVLIVTHPDLDHVSYLAPGSGRTPAPSVVGDRHVGLALLSLDEAAYRESATGVRLMNWLAGAAAPGAVRFLTTADASAEDEPSDLFACGGASIHILAASEPSGSSDTSMQRNTPSIVLRIESHLAQPFTALLTGDATWETHRAILERYSAEFLDVDVLKVSHHGSRTSIPPAHLLPIDMPSVAGPHWPWLRATSPDYAIATCGHRGGYFLPRCEVTREVGSASSLASVGCHAVECGAPAEGDCETIGGELDDEGEWCGYATTRAVFTSQTNGDVRVRVRPEGWVVDFERGQLDAAACE